jgi:methylmalonyl-CoA mutase N-terminal domain/subunit
MEEKQRERLACLREERDDGRAREALDALEEACRGDDNLVPYILDCSRAECTLFEIRDAMAEVFGAYQEPVFF